MTLVATNRGFSLIELLITLALAAGIGLFLGTIFIQNNQLFQSQNAKISENVEINNLQLLFNKYIRNAAAVVNGYPLTNPTVTSDANHLVLALPSVDNAGNVIINSYDYIVIAPDPLQPAILRQIIYPQGGSSRGYLNQALTTGLTYLNFNYLNDSKLPSTPSNATIINFSVNITNGTGTNIKTASGSGTVNLRNN